MVTLHVYDITTPDDPALIPRLNNTLYQFGIGVFHSGVEVYGVEYAFGGHYDDLSGIFTSPPKQAQGVVYRCSVELGHTPFPRETVDAVVDAMGSKQFLGNNYSLINNNCNNFSQAFVQCLMTEKKFPTWINRLAGIAINVSCILPPAVEQPLSELAPTAANMDRRRTSIAAPPSSARGDRKHATPSTPRSPSSRELKAQHRRRSTSALRSSSFKANHEEQPHVAVGDRIVDLRAQDAAAVVVDMPKAPVVPSLTIVPDDEEDDASSSSSSDDDYYHFSLAHPATLQGTSSAVTTSVASVVDSPPRRTLQSHPGKMLVRPQSPTRPPPAVTRLSFAGNDAALHTRTKQGRVVAIEGGRVGVRLDSPGSPVSQSSY
jgi:deubiquitinase DESI2